MSKGVYIRTKSAWNKGKKLHYLIWNKGKKGLQVPWNKGKTHSEESRKKISLAKIGKPSHNKGKRMSEESRKKMSLARLGKSPWNKGLKRPEMSGEKHPMFGKKRPEFSGENHPRWIIDRSLVKRRQERNNPEYKQWRQSVWLRDNFKCKIANPSCSGKIEAHHILGWSQYPELRYEVNNGITLCHTHHPRKRKDEMILSPFFQELVLVNLK